MNFFWVESEGASVLPQPPLTPPLSDKQYMNSDFCPFHHEFIWCYYSRAEKKKSENADPTPNSIYIELAPEEKK